MAFDHHIRRPFDGFDKAGFARNCRAASVGNCTSTSAAMTAFTEDSRRVVCDIPDLIIRIRRRALEQQTTMAGCLKNVENLPNRSDCQVAYELEMLKHNTALEFSSILVLEIVGREGGWAGLSEYIR